MIKVHPASIKALFVLLGKHLQSCFSKGCTGTSVNFNHDWSTLLE
jgi:hypothetical protein